MAGNSWDVVIVGAGMAGLAAAGALRQSGCSVLILEARDRVGGRVWTRHEPDLTAPIELGAEFIHGRIPETLGLLQAAGKAALAISGTRWNLRNGQLETRSSDLFEAIRAALERSRALEKPDIPFASFLDQSLRQGLSTEACKLARTFVEGFDAADPSRVSTHFVAREWGSGGMLDDLQFRPADGYSSVVAALAGELGRDRIRLQLQTPVRRIRWAKGAVDIEASVQGEPFSTRAARAIVTLPLGVLQADEVQFVPALEAKREALAGLASGPVLKLGLRFRKAFWEELDHGRYRDASFFHSPATTFPTFWTSLPLRTPLLTAWVGGPRAETLSEHPTQQIVREALDSLAGLFGSAVARAFELEASYLHNWQRDALARGAYSYVLAGGGSARRSLAAPLAQTLFFAGEATEEDAATVPSAIRSGLRAAREVKASMEAAA
ncbi:MAG TPA: NAD(P)/FAD-dependent oxidoreductase [Steroidobacteraceae bacterium]|nr:NAD(P)/FAD-dependent oxidoreductase [Steroidobacteraceae bacterium]